MKYKLLVSANKKELKDERFAIKDVVNDNSVLRGDIIAFETIF